MNATNYTPIQHLLPKNDVPQHVSVGASKESLNISHDKVPAALPEQSHQERTKHLEIQKTVEHTPHPDLAAFIEPRPESVHLEKAVQVAGVQQSGNTAFPSQQSVKIPLSDNQVWDGLHAPIRSSVRWMAEFCLYLLKRAHQTLRSEKGKVERVRIS